MPLLLVPALAACTTAAPGSSATGPASPGSVAVTEGVPSATPPQTSSPDAASPPPSMVAPTATPAGSSAILNCGDRGRDFPADALSDPGTAESGTDPAAAILRSTVATAPAETLFPEHGWHRVLDDERGAWFVAAGDDRIPWWQVNVGDLNGVLQATEAGACQLSNTPPAGVSFGRWWLDPTAPVPSANATEVSIFVRETVCASGHSPDGRVLTPTIVVDGDAIYVTIGIRQQQGGQDCQANPAYPMRLELPQALGARRLFDASWYPPRPVSTKDPG